MENRDAAWHSKRELIVPILFGVIAAIIPWVIPMDYIVMLICWLVLAGCIEWLIFILVSSKRMRFFVLIVVAILLIIGGFYRIREQWTKDHVVPIKEKTSHPVGEQPKEPPYKEGARQSQSKAPFNVDSKVEVKLIFKDSPLFTSERKQQITAEINAFRRYLIGLGFDVPKETPPIGITHGKGFTAGYSNSHTIDLAFTEQIYIGDELIANPASWRNAYAQYFFRRIFGYEHLGNAELEFRRSWTGVIFASYFAGSYWTERPWHMEGFNGWVKALWDIRDSCGQEFTDRALFYAFKFKEVKSSFKKFEDDFNEDFAYRFFWGVEVVDNDFHNRPKIIQVLKKYNLLLKPSILGEKIKETQQKLPKAERTKPTFQVNEKYPKKEPFKIPNLHELFDKEFSTLFRSSADRIFGIDDGTKKITIKISEKEYLDFQAKSKFIGFYIPSSLYSYRLCESLADEYKATIKDFESVGEFKFGHVAESNITSSRDLVFSGRIYIYHEDNFSLQQLATLERLYESKGLSVIFRGHAYLLSVRDSINE